MENTASLTPGSASSSKCFLYARKHRTAPMKAPDELREDVPERVADRRFDRRLDGASRAGEGRERCVGGEQAEGDRRVEVRPRLERGVDAGEDGEAPSEVDEEPAAVEALLTGRITFATTPVPRRTSIPVPRISETNAWDRIVSTSYPPFC